MHHTKSGQRVHRSRQVEGCPVRCSRKVEDVLVDAELSQDKDERQFKTFLTFVRQAVRGLSGCSLLTSSGRVFVNVYFTRAGVKVPRLVAMLVTSFVAAVLMVTMLPSDGFAEDAPSSDTSEKPELPKGSDSDGDGDFDRPDAVSAAVTARLVKKPVEDLSKRTETRRTFANPDGTAKGGERADR